MSLPLAYIISARSSQRPMFCATVINFSLGLRRVIISQSVNSTCPPSSTGIGKRFIIANITESNAVIFQKLYQFHTSGKMPPIRLLIQNAGNTLSAYMTTIKKLPYSDIGRTFTQNSYNAVEYFTGIRDYYYNNWQKFGG